MSENRKIRHNKDSDLLKIQILADYYQASFSFFGSVVSGAIIGLLVVAITLRLENVFSDITYYIVLGVILIFASFYITRIYRSYHSDLEKIDNLFIRVQNGETLQSITELRKMKKE
jgi:predicted transporter